MEEHPELLANMYTKCPASAAHYFVVKVAPAAHLECFPRRVPVEEGLEHAFCRNGGSVSLVFESEYVLRPSIRYKPISL
jgi:hypothetical protein